MQYKTKIKKLSNKLIFMQFFKKKITFFVIFYIKNVFKIRHIS